MVTQPAAWRLATRAASTTVAALVTAIVAALAGAGCDGGTTHGSGSTPTETPAVKLRPATTATDSGRQATPIAPTRAAPLGAMINNGPRTRREVALTFDADMSPQMIAMLRDGSVARWYDPLIMKTLRDTKTPATVFMTAMWAKEYPTLARELAANPLYEIENHSYDHAAWSHNCYGLPSVRTSVSRQREVSGSAQAIEDVTGVKVHYFRYPGGCHTPRNDAFVRRLGEQPLGWDVVSGDPFQQDPAVVERNVLNRVKGGSIVVMHFVGAPNAPATGRSLAVIIPELRKRGFTFVRLDELLDSNRA